MISRENNNIMAERVMIHTNPLSSKPIFNDVVISTSSSKSNILLLLLLRPSFIFSSDSMAMTRISPCLLKFIVY